MTTLFHYCSTETFVSIITNKSIRLSSLTLSNDTLEGKIILDTLMQIARESSLPEDAISRLEKALIRIFDLFDGLGFCLSENHDLLSQWRGYADDGRGVCIGFNSEYLERLSKTRTNRSERGFALKKLIYEVGAQREKAAEYFEKLKGLVEQGAFAPEESSLLFPNNEDDKKRIAELTQEAYVSVVLAMLNMLEFKNPAFEEEQEWRLISFSVRSGVESDTKFRACGDKIVPFIEVHLEEGDVPAIESITLGPKHQTPNYVLDRMLSQSGFNGVEIRKSSASYR